MKRFCALLAALMLLMGCAASGRAETLRVTFLSVGKADCILLECGGRAAMIDAGEQNDGEDIVALLEQKGIDSLDFLLLTHLDKDHIGGADVLLERVKVGTVYAPDYDKGNKQYDQYRAALETLGIDPVHPAQPLSFDFAGCAVTLLPGAQPEYEQSNDYSILMELEHGGVSFLFAGDAEDERLAEYLSGAPSPVTVLKVPHHGRKCGRSEAFFSAVSPQYAVVTCSEEEMPDEEVVSLLKGLDAEVHGTVYGDVVLLSDGRSVRAA